MKSCVHLSKMTSSMCHQPELCRQFALAFSLSSLLLLGGCSELPIQVSKEEPKVNVSAISETTTASKALPASKACTKTSWKYVCQPDIRFKTLRRERVVAGEAVVIRISKIIVHIGLKIDTQLPEKVASEIVEHEKGHVAICLDNYKNAQEIADRAAQPWVGKTLQGEGSTFRDAVKKILTDAQKDIEQQYLADTADAVTETSSIYDRLTTENSKSDYIMHAVSDAQIEYKRLKPGLKSPQNKSR
ncbi:MAG: hypothetical protein IAF58_05860 [Leptolyngbya sp.]|nr:hypothetical protein [Candidatus Melainabacteria bacterium]